MALRIVLICEQVGTEADKPARKPRRIKILVASIVVVVVGAEKIESQQNKSDSKQLWSCCVPKMFCSGVLYCLSQVSETHVAFAIDLVPVVVKVLHKGRLDQTQG